MRGVVAYIRVLKNALLRVNVSVLRILVILEAISIVFMGMIIIVEILGAINIVFSILKIMRFVIVCRLTVEIIPTPLTVNVILT